MTLDEATSLLGVGQDASAGDILAAYSAKAAQAKAAGSPDSEAVQARLQSLGEARAALMTHRQLVQGSQQRTAVAKAATTSTTGTPRYGEVAPAAAPVSAWGDEDSPRSPRRTPEEEDKRKRRSFLIAVVGLVLSLTAWLNVLLLPVTVIGMGLCVWSLVRIRGYGSGLYRCTRIVAVISFVLGTLAVIGCVLLLTHAGG